VRSWLDVSLSASLPPLALKPFEKVTEHYDVPVGSRCHPGPFATLPESCPHSVGRRHRRAQCYS
jgi:hypothetical protein